METTAAERRIDAEDGTALAVLSWPVARPRAGILIVHGLGEHAGRYAALAHALNAAEIAVYAFDLRGHGRSDGPRGTIRRPDDFVRDTQKVWAALGPELPLHRFVLGHSLGGLIAAQFAVRNRTPVTGIALSSPALALRMSAFQALLLALGSHLAPDRPNPNGLDVTRLSHDQRVVAAYRADPLVHAVVTARLVRGMQAGMAECLAGASGVTTPMLVQVAGADALVDPHGSKRFYAALPEGIGTLHWYDDAYHEIYNENPERRAVVLSDLTRWLDARIAS